MPANVRPVNTRRGDSTYVLKVDGGTNYEDPYPPIQVEGLYRGQASVFSQTHIGAIGWWR